MRSALPAAMSVDLVPLMTLTLSVTAIFGRRQSGEFTKCPRKRTRFAKANLPVTESAGLCNRLLARSIRRAIW